MPAVLLVTMHLVLCSLRLSQGALGFWERCLQENAAVFFVGSTVDTRASVLSTERLPNLTREGGLLGMLRIPAQCLVHLWIPFCVSHVGVWVISRFFFFREGGPRIPKVRFSSIAKLGLTVDTYSASVPVLWRFSTFSS